MLRPYRRLAQLHPICEPSQFVLTSGACESGPQKPTVDLAMALSHNCIRRHGIVVGVEVLQAGTNPAQFVGGHSMAKKS